MSAAIARNRMHALSHAPGFTLFYYDGASCGHNVTQIAEPGYFNVYADYLATGDHVHVNAMDGGALVRVARVLPTVAVHFMGLASAPWEE